MNHTMETTTTNTIKNKMPPSWVHLLYFLGTYWILFGYILGTFNWYVSDEAQILGTSLVHIWVHLGYNLGHILDTFWVHLWYIVGMHLLTIPL